MDDEPETLDTTPTGRDDRRDRLRKWKRSWWIIVAVCFLVVIVSAIGLADAEEGDTVQIAVFTATAALAAVFAFMATVARARVGSILGEGELEQPAARDDDPLLERDESGEVVGRRSPDDDA